MQVVPRPFLFFAILLLAVGFSFMADVSDTVPRHDQVKVRCAWPAGDTSYKHWYVEDIGGAEDERQGAQASGHCVGVQAF